MTDAVGGRSWARDLAALREARAASIVERGNRLICGKAELSESESRERNMRPKSRQEFDAVACFKRCRGPAAASHSNKWIKRYFLQDII